jgi:hypothetical protein
MDALAGEKPARHPYALDSRHGRRQLVFDTHPGVAVIERDPQAFEGRDVHLQPRHFAIAPGVTPESL